MSCGTGQLRAAVYPRGKMLLPCQMLLPCPMPRKSGRT